MTNSRPLTPPGIPFGTKAVSMRQSVRNLTLCFLLLTVIIVKFVSFVLLSEIVPWNLFLLLFSTIPLKR